MPYHDEDDKKKPKRKKPMKMAHSKKPKKMAHAKKPKKMAHGDDKKPKKPRKAMVWLKNQKNRLCQSFQAF